MFLKQLFLHVSYNDWEYKSSGLCGKGGLSIQCISLRVMNVKLEVAAGWKVLGLVALSLSAISGKGDLKI